MLGRWWLLVAATLVGAQRRSDDTVMHKMSTHHITLTDQVADVGHFNLKSIMSDMLNINAPTSSHNDTRCKVDSEIYRAEVLDNTPWAVRMYDSSTKLPDGLLAGNVIQMGNFDECLDIKGLDTDGSPLFSGQYCLAGISITRTNDSEGLVHKNTFKSSLVESLIGRRLQWSVCIPSSCSALHLQQHLQVRMTQLLLQNESFAELNVTVFPGNCYTADGKRMQKADWIVISVLIVFLLLVVLSTCYDIFLGRVTAEGKEATVLVAFSAYKNGRALFATSSSGQMASVHGIKFLSMVWVVVFHKYSVMVETPNVNSDTVLDGLKYDWTQMPLSNGGSLAVNTFFVVSGLLLTYVFLRDRDAKRPFNLISFYVYRYIRLTPIYAVVIAMYATVCFQMGSGPLWNATMGSHRDNCIKHWWRNLLYINNYQNVTSELCVVQSWYLAADTQLYWLSPLLLYPLWRWPKLGKLELAALFVVPIAVPFWLTYSRKFPWADVKNVSEETRNKYFPQVYAATYTRAAPFLVGIVLGYVLYNTKKQKIDLPQWIVFGGWAVSTAISLTIVYALHIYYKVDHPYNPIEAAFFGSLHPLAWGLVIGWIIFACEKGYAGPVKPILSWRMFQPLSKLSYSAYLVHFMVFYYDLSITRSPGHFDHFSVFHIVLGDLVIILFLSTIFALTFEMPVLNLDKLLFKPESRLAVRRPSAMAQLKNVVQQRRSVHRDDGEGKPNIEGGGRLNVAFQPGDEVDVTKM